MDMQLYESQRDLLTIKILSPSGEVINRIIADEGFASQHYEHYEIEGKCVIEAMEEEWRNTQLKETDSLMLLPDYPYKEQLAQWRQILRDWPSTEDFPETRPVSFDEFLRQG